jgi:hypothetical protein
MKIINLRTEPIALGASILFETSSDKIGTARQGKVKMFLTLPDQSTVRLNRSRLKFTHVGVGRRRSAPPSKRDPARFKIDFDRLAECIEFPTNRFGDCFRRISDHPRYSPKASVYDFDVGFLTRVYSFRGSYQGGTFSSSTTEWSFLDGGIISHNGYGWGSHSWTVVQGAEALRTVCLFFGIIQPLRIKGEGPRRPLSLLLDEMTDAPLTDPTSLASRFPH